MAGEAYPMFRSAISSTPFPGTMADTTTPTPADGAQEQVGPYVSPSDADLAANEQEDEAARQQRIAEWTRLAQADEGEAARISALKWSNHPGGSKLARWQRAHLNGGRPDVEPPEMMFQRFEAIQRLRQNVLNYREQIRLESQLSPYQEALRRNSGEAQAEQNDVAVRLKWWEGVNAQLPEGQKLPPDTLLMLAQNPQASTRGRYGEVDPIKQLTDAAKYGQEVDEPGVQLAPEGPLRLAAAAGQRQGAKVRAEKKKDDTLKADLGGFTPSGLVTAVNAQYRQTLATIPKTGVQEYDGYDFLGQPIKKGTPIHTPEEAKKARERTAQVYPAIMKLAPAWVEQGTTPPVDDATKAGGQGQSDIKALLKNRKKAQ